MSAELSFPEVFLAVAAAVPERTCLVHRDVRRSFSELSRIVCQVGHVIAGAGAGFERPRTGLSGWESGQGHVALVLRNGPEYLEAMLGAGVARAVPFNVNFRYTVPELTEVLADARPRVVVVHDEFADTVNEAIGRAGLSSLVLQVPDQTGRPLAPGGVRWSDAVTAASDQPPRTDWSPDDLYMLFTGGTTGKPKGVLWRHADALVAAFGVVSRSGAPFDSVESLVAHVVNRSHQRVVLPAPPLIHGAAQWVALGTLLLGGRVVIQDDVTTLSPDSILSTIEREEVTELLIVGDAFGRPLVESLEGRPRQLPSLRSILNGGAALSDTVRDRLLEALPHVRVVDNLGSSESGRQAARQYSGRGTTTNLEPIDDNVILSEDRSRVLTSADGEVGWLARRGRLPLGYLNDEAKTGRSFPVVDGVRYVVPGDRAQMLPDGRIQVLGRDATTINTGGEKVFGEEVEAVLVSHPAVRDALVVGRPSERWGQEVVALIVIDPAREHDDLVAYMSEHLARYKQPKQLLTVPEIPRTPAGKPDHRAAHAILDRLGAQMEIPPSTGRTTPVM